MTPEETKTRPTRLQAALLLGGIFIAVVVGKIILFHDAPGPVVFHDESLNRYYARAIFDLEPYVSGVDRDPMYPPAYPLALSPAYLVPGDGWFDAMRVINAIIGSLLPLAVYLLANRVCPGWPAMAAAAVSAVIPFHAAYCPLLISENLAMPLFTFAFAMALRPGRAGLVCAGFLGLVCGAAFLTKYLFLAYAPFVAAAFLAMQWRERNDIPAGRRIADLLKLSGSAIIAAAIIVAAWLWYSLGSGNGLLDSLGIFLAPTAEKSTPPFEGFVFYLVLLLTGLILMLLLVLPAMIMFYVFLRKRENFPPAARILGFVFIIMCPLLLLFVARFCWVESLVYLPLKDWKIEKISHFISLRYLIYLLPLAVPLAVAGVCQLSRLQGRWSTAIIACVVSAGAAVAARLILFDGLIWNFPDGVTRTWVNAPDILAFSIDWIWFAVVAIFAVVICLVSARSVKAGLVCLVVLAAAAYPAGSIAAHGKWWTPDMKTLALQMRKICGPKGSVNQACFNETAGRNDPASTLYIVDTTHDGSIQHARTLGWYAVFWIDNRINVAPGNVKTGPGGIEYVAILADQKRMGVQNCRGDMVIDPSRRFTQAFLVAPDDAIIPLPLDKIMVTSPGKR